MKELIIDIPEGYEIDKEKSTFEKIVFKKKESIVNCWEDIKVIDGTFISGHCELINVGNVLNAHYNRNVFLNEKYAKSALALAQISQLLPYYDANVFWNNIEWKWCINRNSNKIIIDNFQYTYHLLSFKTYEEAERFLKYNEQLVKDYLMID